MTRPAHAIRRPLAAPPGVEAGLCVLASGSRGNCSVLVIPDGPGEHAPRRVILFDAGLSPRRTTLLLANLGIEPWEVDDIVLTHLDTDHIHPGWSSPRLTAWRASPTVVAGATSRST